MKLTKKFTNAANSMTDTSLIATLMIITTILVAVGIVLSRLWWGDIRFNNRVLEKKNQVNRTLEQNVAALPALSENFAALEANGPKPQTVLQALPTGEEFSDLAKELEAVASLAGAQLVSVNRGGGELVAPPSGTLTPIQLDLQATVVGNYGDLDKFMRMVEQTIRPLRIIQANFNGSGPDVSLALSLVTWWQPPTQIGNEKEVITE